MGETIREHLTTEDVRLSNTFQKALKDNDRKPYEDWLNRPENYQLRGALKILEKGLEHRLNWDGVTHSLVPKKEKATIGPSLHAFLKRTDTIVMFTDGFSSHRSTTFGGHINGGWQEGEDTYIGQGKERYKSRKRNVIWISSDLRSSPVAIAMLIAHEIGHGIATEYRDNYPIPAYCDPKVLEKPPYSLFPYDQRDDDDRLCYPLEGLLAREMGLNPDMNVQQHTPMTDEARRWYRHVFGNYTTAAFRDKLRLGTVFERERIYSKKSHRCGMRCKFFGEYGYCDHVVKIPPCWQYEQHLEGWNTPDDGKGDKLPDGFVPAPKRPPPSTN